MSKIIKNIIDSCYQCPYQYNGKCFKDDKHKPIKIKKNWFPSWCPLEDYKDENN